MNQEAPRLSLVDSLIATMTRANETNKNAYKKEDFEQVRAAMLLWEHTTAPVKAKVFNKLENSTYMDKSRVDPDLIFFSTTSLSTNKDRLSVTAAEFLGVNRQGQSCHEIALFEPEKNIKLEKRTMKNVINSSIEAASDAMTQRNPLSRFIDKYNPSNLHQVRMMEEACYLMLEKLSDNDFRMMSITTALTAIAASRQALAAIKADLPSYPSDIIIPTTKTLYIPMRYRTPRSQISPAEYIKLLELTKIAGLPFPRNIIVTDEEKTYKRK